MSITAEGASKDCQCSFNRQLAKGREIASEQSEEADDRDAGAGSYFLNGQCPLRTPPQRRCV
jgi:hypothetical protein